MKYQEFSKYQMDEIFYIRTKFTIDVLAFLEHWNTAFQDRKSAAKLDVLGGQLELSVIYK